MYWRLTRREVVAVLQAIVKRVSEQNRAADLRAGLIAATITNVHRRKGAALVHPQDFVRMPKRFMTVKEAQTHMNRWAKNINKTVAEKVASNG